jgi:hypothetical protein
MSLTLGPTLESVSRDGARIADTMLLCTRFMFVRYLDARRAHIK